MTALLKQSTVITVQLGPAVDKTDGVTEEIALAPTVEVSKNGAVFAARSSVTAIAHDQNGWYRVELDATDTNTLGRLVVKFDDAATHLPVWHEFLVVPANVYDSLVGGTDKLQADVAEWVGVVPNALATGRVDASVGAMATGVLTATAIAADAITDAKVAADVTIASVTGSVGSVTGAVGSVTGNVGGNVVGSVGSVATGGITAASIADGAIDRATFAADTGLQTIRSATAQAGAAGTITLDTGASATDDFYNDTTIRLTGGTGAGQVRRITDYVGATKVATIKPNWATAPDATSTFAVLAETSVWDEVTADHLDAGSTGASLNAAGSAGDPWGTALPGAYGAGSAGNILGTRLDVAVSTRSTLTAADVWAAATRSLTDKAGFSLSAAGVQAIWDALTSALTTVGSVGKRIADNLDATVSSRLAAASYTAPPTAAQVSTQVWTEPVPGTFPAGSAGNLAGTRLDAAVSSRSTLTAPDVWASPTRTLTSFGTLATDVATSVWAAGSRTLTGFGTLAADVWAHVTRTLTSGAAPSATDNAAAVWGATASSYNVAGTMGQKLNAAGGAADPLLNVVPGTYAVGTAGWALGNLTGGSGTVPYTYTVTHATSGAPVDGVKVTVTSDRAGTIMKAQAYTDSAGQVTFMLDAGSYYFWRQKDGWSFLDPDGPEVVS